MAENVTITQPSISTGAVITADYLNAGKTDAENLATAVNELIGFENGIYDLTFKATVDDSTENPACAVSLEDDNKALAFAFTGIKGKDGADGASITAMQLTKDAEGKITGGKLTLSNNSTVDITVGEE